MEVCEQKFPITHFAAY